MSSGNEEHGGMQAVLGEEEDHQSAGAQTREQCCEKKSFLFQTRSISRVWTLLLHTDTRTWHGRRRTHQT